MQPLSGNQRPDLLTAVMNMSLVLPATENASLQILFKCPTPAIVFGNATKPPRFAQVHNPVRLPCKTTSERPKVFRTHLSSFAPLTSKCASRHNGVHFFDISTSKSAPTMVCFVHFDFEMCFAPQRRALFRHLNFQKCSDHGVLCTFWLRNVLRATRACTFSTSQLPKVLRPWCALYILTSTCASRHNNVQFLISHLPSGLRTCRFSEPTFRPSGATNHWKKHSVSRLFYFFAHLDLLSSETFSFLIFFLLLFSSLTLPISAFHLSILSEVWLLNFLRSVDMCDIRLYPS